MLAVVAIIVVGKSVAAAALVLAFGYPLRTALTVSAGLAQIGEFSFILGALGVSLGLLSAEGHSLIVAGALISIALNPLCFRCQRADRPLARQRAASGPAAATTPPTRSPSCRCRPTRSTCRSRSCSSATAGSASASPPS